MYGYLFIISYCIVCQAPSVTTALKEIEINDVVIYFLSPDSISDETCNMCIDYAVKHKKKK